MKMPVLAAAVIAFTVPALAQTPADHDQHHPAGAAASQSQPAHPPQAQMPSSGSGMPAGQMMQGQGMMGGMMQGQGMMGQGMMGGPGRGMMGQGMMGAGRGMMGRFSPEDMNAFIDARIAAIHAGLKLSAEQEKLWPPVEIAMRDLARQHLSQMQAMRQARGMMASDPVGLLRGMADRMNQNAEAMRTLADAAAPLYATLDEAQKGRLQVLVRMGSRGTMGRGMMGGMISRGMMGGMMSPGGATMQGDSDDDDDNGDVQ